MDRGRRPEFVVEGLIRSLKGFSEVSRLRLKGQDRMKGDGECVMTMVSKADERMDPRYA